jgi:hypothetical protein
MSMIIRNGWTIDKHGICNYNKQQHCNKQKAIEKIGEKEKQDNDKTSSMRVPGDAFWNAFGEGGGGGGDSGNARNAHHVCLALLPSMHFSYKSKIPTLLYSVSLIGLETFFGTILRPAEFDFRSEACVGVPFCIISCFLSKSLFWKVDHSEWSTEQRNCGILNFQEI